VLKIRYSLFFFFEHNCRWLVVASCYQSIFLTWGEKKSNWVVLFWLTGSCVTKRNIWNINFWISGYDVEVVSGLLNFICLQPPQSTLVIILSRLNTLVALWVHFEFVRKVFKVVYELFFWRVFMEIFRHWKVR